MSIPNTVMALANHKGAAIVHAGNALIPVKILDIESEVTPTRCETTFKCLVVDSVPAEKVTLHSVGYGPKPYTDGTERIGKQAKTCSSPFDIDRVIFNDPATIVFWADGTKTVVKCQKGDIYSPETGLALCIAKKALGNKSNFNNVFHEWIPEEEPEQPKNEAPEEKKVKGEPSDDDLDAFIGRMAGAMRNDIICTALGVKPAPYVKKEDEKDA